MDILIISFEKQAPKKFQYKLRWRVQLRHPDTKKAVQGGYFQTQAEAEEKAQQMAQQLDLQVEPGLCLKLVQAL